MNFKQFLIESEKNNNEALYPIIMKEVSLIDPKNKVNIEERGDMLFQYDSSLHLEYILFMLEVGSKLKLDDASRDEDLEALNKIKVSNTLFNFLIKLK